MWKVVWLGKLSEPLLLSKIAWGWVRVPFLHAAGGVFPPRHGVMGGAQRDEHVQQWDHKERLPPDSCRKEASLGLVQDQGMP